MALMISAGSCGSQKGSWALMKLLFQTYAGSACRTKVIFLSKAKEWSPCCLLW